MSLISKEEAYLRFAKFGRNSSHFVWFLTDLKFFETSNGWVFGFHTSGKVTVFALEPLIPKTEGVPYNDAHEFEIAWGEVQSGLKPKISMFVSVYDDFFKVLRSKKFQGLHVGKEPYVNLKDCIPTGKSGKGVRAARNQALRAGIRVEEWSHEKILSHPQMRKDMEKILKHWKSRNLFEMGGNLNTVNPFEKMEARRYFLALSEKDSLQAYLVGTPIPAKNSYFLEDMVVRPRAARGSGELLTLEAMVYLSETNAAFASLGVVSITSMDKSSAIDMPSTAEFVLVTVPKYLTSFYNVGGLEVFRKRFKPQYWENIYLAVRNEKESGVSDSTAWFLSLFAMLKSFKPRLNITWGWMKEAVTAPIVRHPVSYGVLAISTALFLLINQGGNLPIWGLERLGFSGDSPLYEWIYRSIISDFLYFNFTHFAISISALIALIRWMEKSHKVKFVFTYIMCVSIFDDIVNHIILVRPYEYFHPKLFQKLITVKDVGGSLWIATFIGLQLCQLRRSREVFFALFSVGFVLCFAFSAVHMSNLVLNLNHFLFLVFGFLTGKFKFEYERERSRKVAKQKPPTAKSVNTEKKHNRRSTDREPVVENTKEPDEPKDDGPTEEEAS